MECLRPLRRSKAKRLRDVPIAVGRSLPLHLPRLRREARELLGGDRHELLRVRPRAVRSAFGANYFRC